MATKKKTNTFVPKTKSFGGKRYKRARRLPYSRKSEAQKRQKTVGATRRTRLQKCAGGYMVWVGVEKKRARNPSGLKSLRKPLRRRNPARRAAAGDRIAARELELFAVNDGGLYRRMRQPIEANLTRKRIAGTYDKTKAVKAWMNFADEAAREYNVQFGSGTRSVGIFDKSTRLLVAKSIAADFHAEVMLTKPKKKAKKTRARR